MATSWYPNSNNCCQIWVSKRIQNSLEMCILSLFDLKNAGNWPFQNPLKMIILRIPLNKIEILIKLIHFKAYCRQFTPCKRSFRFWSRICSKYLFFIIFTLISRVPLWQQVLLLGYHNVATLKICYPKAKINYHINMIG